MIASRNGFASDRAITRPLRRRAGIASRGRLPPVVSVSPGGDELERRLAAVASIDLGTRSTDELVRGPPRAAPGRARADTAAVLVTDASGSQLVALAAVGLEDEVLQGFRLAVGAGFSGRVAATRTPMILDEVTASTVTNPIILNRGLRSMAAVPLIAAGTLIGVLHTGSESPAFFGGDDLAVMQVVGERIATALFTERTASERSAARILQRSLLPGRLPRVEGIEMASRFVPAAGFGVGGDWFDAFVLPDGRLGIVMGDVTGSGLAAAVVMGRLRSALRAYALDTADPGRGARQAQPQVHALRARPDGDRPVPHDLARPGDRDDRARPATRHPSAPAPARPRASSPARRAHRSASRRTARACVTHAPLPPGTTLVCFTDGLYERRTEPIDRQLERLRAAVTADTPRDGVRQRHGHHGRLPPRRGRHRAPRARPHRTHPIRIAPPRPRPRWNPFPIPRPSNLRSSDRFSRVDSGTAPREGLPLRRSRREASPRTAHHRHSSSRIPTGSTPSPHQRWNRYRPDAMARSIWSGTISFG